MSLGSDDMDIKAIGVLETANLKVLTKESVDFDQLRYWQNTDVIRKRLLNFF